MKKKSSGWGIRRETIPQYMFKGATIKVHFQKHFLYELVKLTFLLKFLLVIQLTQTHFKMCENSTSWKCVLICFGAMEHE